MCPIDDSCCQTSIRKCEYLLFVASVQDTYQWQRRVGFEPRAFRMRSGCDATTLCAPVLAACCQKLICMCAHFLFIAVARNKLPQPQLRHSCANGHTGIRAQGLPHAERM